MAFLAWTRSKLQTAQQVNHYWHTNYSPCSVSREAAFAVILQETLPLKAESQFKPHFPVSITPNTADNQQQQAFLQKGSPVFAAPYRYGYLHGSTQCLVSSHKTTSKWNTCTTNCYCLSFFTTKQLNIFITNTATIPYVSVAPSWALTLTARSSVSKDKWRYLCKHWWDQACVHQLGIRSTTSLNELVALVTSSISGAQGKMKHRTISARISLTEKQQEYARERKKAIAMPCFVFHGKTESLYYGN